MVLVKGYLIDETQIISARNYTQDRRIVGCNVTFKDIKEPIEYRELTTQEIYEAIKSKPNELLARENLISDLKEVARLQSKEVVAAYNEVSDLKRVNVHLNKERDRIYKSVIWLYEHQGEYPNIQELTKEGAGYV